MAAEGRVVARAAATEAVATAPAGKATEAAAGLDLPMAVVATVAAATAAAMAAAARAEGKAAVVWVAGMVEVAMSGGEGGGSGVNSGG